MKLIVIVIVVVRLPSQISFPSHSHTLYDEHSIFDLNGFDDHFIGRDGIDGAKGDSFDILFGVTGNGALQRGQLMIIT